MFDKLLGKLKDAKTDRIAGKAKKAGKSVDMFKHDRKEKLKETLSNTLGGGERGLLTQKKSFEQEANKMSQENRAENMQQDYLGLSKIGGSDRTDMMSNAFTMRANKKGHGTFDF